MMITQLLDTEIVIYGMITLENGDDTLASSFEPAKDPEYWDVHLNIHHDEENAEEHLTVLEIENILDRDRLDKVLEVLRELFPDSGVEEV